MLYLSIITPDAIQWSINVLLLRDVYVNQGRSMGWSACPVGSISVFSKIISCKAWATVYATWQMKYLDLDNGHCVNNYWYKL